jgi:membrane-associated protein
MLALMNVESLLSNGGLLVLGLIVFAESGLLVGFFLPGDSLLFIAGFLASEAGGNVLPPLPLVLLVAASMAIIGDQVGYIIGRRVGPALFARPKSRLFDPAHVDKAQAFFDKHGAKTIVLARFVPIVRTFAPVLAGVGRMDYRTFVRYNILGGLGWGVGLPVLGFFLGQIDAVKHNIEAAILGIVFLSVLPVIIEFVKHRRNRAH